MASALGMNKILARQAFKSVGLKVPSGLEIILENGPAETAKKIFRNMPPPWVIKYPSGGSSVGVFIARNFDDLEGALEKISSFSSNSSKILVEEYIKGREAT